MAKKPMPKWLREQRKHAEASLDQAGDFIRGYEFVAHSEDSFAHVFSFRADIRVSEQEDDLITFPVEFTFPFGPLVNMPRFSILCRSMVFGFDLSIDIKSPVIDKVGPAQVMDGIRQLTEYVNSPRRKPGGGNRGHYTIVPFRDNVRFLHVILSYFRNISFDYIRTDNDRFYARWDYKKPLQNKFEQFEFSYEYTQPTEPWRWAQIAPDTSSRHLNHAYSNEAILYFLERELEVEPLEPALLARETGDDISTYVMACAHFGLEVNVKDSR